MQYRDVQALLAGIAEKDQRIHSLENLFLNAIRSNNFYAEPFYELGKNIKVIEIFFSYAHEDEDLRDKLQKHLTILKRQGVIRNWYDREISAGTEWAGQIDSHLNTARIILLLISSDFLASDYCYDIELTRAMERHAAGEARVIPVILLPVDWKGAPFSQLQALPKNAEPVTNWANPDQAFADIAKGIRRVVEDLAANP